MEQIKAVQREIAQGTIEVKESNRVSYNPKTRTFGPPPPSPTKKIELLEKTEGRISQFKIPVDRSSPTYLKNANSNSGLIKASIYQKPSPEPLPALPPATNRF